jgi:hypothetical protein
MCGVWPAQPGKTPDEKGKSLFEAAKADWIRALR